MNNIQVGETVNSTDKELATNILLLYGKIMLEGQYEVYDVRSNLNNLMKIMEVNYTVFLTPTDLMLIDQDSNDVKMIATENDSYNFEKIQKTERVIVQFTDKKISMENLYKQLESIENFTSTFPDYIRVLAAGVICAACNILYDQFSMTVIYVFFIGSFGYVLYLMTEKYLRIPVFSTFIYSAVVSLFAVLFHKQGWVGNSYSVIISCMMPLVPGNLFIKAIKNSINGDYISGLAFVAKAMVITFMLVLPALFIATNL